MHINFPRSLLKCRWFFHLESPRSQPQSQYKWLLLRNIFSAYPSLGWVPYPWVHSLSRGWRFWPLTFPLHPWTEQTAFLPDSIPSQWSHTTNPTSRCGSSTFWQTHILVLNKKNSKTISKTLQRREFLKTKNVFKMETWQLLLQYQLGFTPHLFF